MDRTTTVGSWSRCAGSTGRRRIADLAGALAALLLAACDGSDYRSPTAPAPPVPTQGAAELPSGAPNFAGDAVVLAVTGPGSCPFLPRPGDLEPDHRWWVGIAASSFALSLDPVDGPIFEGPLAGRDFADDYRRAGNALVSDCEFREASIAGTFAEDFSSFEAREVQVFGPPERETTVARLHRAQRR